MSNTPEVEESHDYPLSYLCEICHKALSTLIWPCSFVHLPQELMQISLLTKSYDEWRQKRGEPRLEPDEILYRRPSDTWT